MTLAKQDHSIFLVDDAEVAAVRHNIDRLESMIGNILIRDKDFGIIPGTDKPALWKPGADTIVGAFGCHAEVNILHREVDTETGLIIFEHEAPIVRHTDRMVVAYGQGGCNSYEVKYRYRQGQRSCPDCGNGAIIKSRYDPGFYCFPAKGGCGVNFAEFDERITLQETGRVLNPDPLDQLNTILKMSAKRAIVDATLKLPGVARFFTQDMEDETGEPADGEQPSRRPGPAKGTEASKPSESAKEQASGETIGQDQAKELMQMAEDLEFGRKWVIDTISAQWQLTQPQYLSPQQMDTVVALMNKPSDDVTKLFEEDGQRAHDDAQAKEAAAEYDANPNKDTDQPTAPADLPF